MKVLCSVYSLFPLIFLCSCAEPAFPVQRIETVPITWQVGHSSQAIIEAPNGEHSTRLRVQTGSQPDFVVSAPGGLVDLLTGLQAADIFVKSNALHSSHVFTRSDLRTKDGTAIIVVTGWAYASNPGSIRLVSVDKSGKPYLLFSSDKFALVVVEDIDHDGVSEIIGRHAFSETWGRCFTSYAPLSVYTLPKSAEGKVELSLPLSEQYNRTNYVGWVGPNASEEWAIVECAPGGLKIVKASEAEKLFELN
jgi:hypothetical protein